MGIMGSRTESDGFARMLRCEGCGAVAVESAHNPFIVTIAHEANCWGWDGSGAISDGVDPIHPTLVWMDDLEDLTPRVLLDANPTPNKGQ